MMERMDVSRCTPLAAVVVISGFPLPAPWYEVSWSVLGALRGLGTWPYEAMPGHQFFHLRFKNWVGIYLGSGCR